jgi:hypothetical protein
MAHLKPEFIPPAQLTDDDIIAIVALGREQALLLDELQEALETADDLRALGVARKLVGLERNIKEQ